MISSTTPGCVMICNLAGMVLQVLRAELGMTPHIIPGRPFSVLMDRERFGLHRVRAAQKQILLDFVPPGDCPAVMLAAPKIEQVLHNVLSPVSRVRMAKKVPA